MTSFNPVKIQKKWRKRWEKEKTFGVDIENTKRPYYNLIMFPYPSAEGLHVGNVYAFTGSDIYGRYMRMKGYDVFEPMGFDAFGIHSENFAIKKGTHPKNETEKNISHFREQLKQLGALFDWDREVDTSKPDYYKWTQWLFLQLYKAGLAYRAKAPVDFCPSCKTVLADEQVISGKCERCGTEVMQKELEQWFLKITKYAEWLLNNLDKLDWSEVVKTAQRNWIGRSEGADLEFQISNFEFRIRIFTTRPDTLFGCTYLILSPEHTFVSEVIQNSKFKIQNSPEVEKYIIESKKKNELERTDLSKEKTGVELKGIKAINPATKEEIPVWVADYVLASYGTGAIMAVPAHDKRDFEFAKKYGLLIKKVIKPKPLFNTPENSLSSAVSAQSEFRMENDCWTGDGEMINSGRFNGMDSEEAEDKIVEFVGGEKKTNYHLRDWLISRQRYWGPPIPIIYCDKCGIVPVPEEDLPVELPYVEDFHPTGTDKSPLATVQEFVNVKCPECTGDAKRETDVSDTFLDSSWYYLGYLSSLGNKKHKEKIKNTPWDADIIKKWLPVNMYIGGKEHAVLHLLYVRFIAMALYDLGYVHFEEPVTKFRANGLLIKDGAKMSKSKGNVVNPDEYFDSYGADILRMHLMFLGPYEQGGDWRGEGIMGIARFLKRVWSLVNEHGSASKSSSPKFQITNFKSQINHNNQNFKATNADALEKITHKTIKKVTEDIENLQYNTAIAAMMEFLNEIQKSQSIISYQLPTTVLLKLLAPFAPYLTEELWHEAQGHKTSIHNERWPEYDPLKIKDDKTKMIVQVNGKVRSKIEVSADVSEDFIKELALKDKNIIKWLGDKEPKRIVVVPKRVVNIVI